MSGRLLIILDKFISDFSGGLKQILEIIFPLLYSFFFAGSF